MKNLLPMILLVIAGMLLPQRAEASTSCVASMTSVQFGDVPPFGGDVDVSATISYSCTITSILSSSKVRLCFSIGAGAQGAGNMAPRQMSSGLYPLAFNLYKDSGRSLIWGTRADSYGAVEATLQIGALIGSATANGTLTVYGRVPSGQAALVPAVYLNSFSGGHTELQYRYNEFLLGLQDFPASCASGGSGGGSGSFPFTASATIWPSCDPSFAVNNIDFGSRGLLDSNFDAVASVSPRCTNTTPYQLGLNDGLHASGSTRRMKSAAGAYVTYELFRDSGRAQRWGNLQSIDTVAGTGSGGAQSVPVYGRVPTQSPTPAAGVYSDTVTVTVYY